jgi:TolB-like protein
MSPLLALLLAATAARPAPRLAVMDIKPQGGAPPLLAAALTEATAIEVRRQATGFSVISSREIASLLAMEHEKQELGCDQVSCLSEIGGALGATRIVNGFLSRFGGTYLLTLRMVDVRHEQILKEGSERIDTQNEDGLLDAVTSAVHQLFPEAPMPPRLGESARPKLATQGDIWEQEEAAAQPAHSHALGISLVVAGVASAGVAVYGFVGPVVGYQNDVSGVNQSLAAKTQPTVSPGKLNGELGTAQTWAIVSSILVAVALGTATAAIFTW